MKSDIYLQINCRTLYTLLESQATKKQPRSLVVGVVKCLGIKYKNTHWQRSDSTTVVLPIRLHGQVEESAQIVLCSIDPHHNYTINNLCCASRARVLYCIIIRG